MEAYDEEEMTMKEHRSRVEDSVVAAFETGARLRQSQDGPVQPDPVDRLVGMIESEAARIRGNDLSALNAVLGSQALALDTIFAELAKRAVKDDIVLYDALRLALKAQSQSRAALDSLVTVARPRALPRRSNKNFDEQTSANGNSPSR